MGLKVQDQYSPNDTVRSLTELLRDVVALINDEVLIENLEHLSALKIRHSVANVSEIDSRDLDSNEILRTRICFQVKVYPGLESSP